MKCYELRRTFRAMIKAVRTYSGPIPTTAVFLSLAPSGFLRKNAQNAEICLRHIYQNDWLQTLTFRVHSNKITRDLHQILPHQPKAQRQNAEIGTKHKSHIAPNPAFLDKFHQQHRRGLKLDCNNCTYCLLRTNCCTYCAVFQAVRV